MNNKKLREKGFTLIEMMIVIGIVGVLSGILSLNYSEFSRRIELVNEAYEIALNIRETEVFFIQYSTDPFNNYSYFKGISIDLNNSNSQFNVYNGTFDGFKHDEKTYYLKNGIEIQSLKAGTVPCAGKSSIDLVFKKDTHDTLIAFDPERFTGLPDADMVQIELGYTDGHPEKRYIIVRETGQIDNSANPICP